MPSRWSPAPTPLQFQIPVTSPAPSLGCASSLETPPLSLSWTPGQDERPSPRQVSSHLVPRPNSAANWLVELSGPQFPDL